MPPSAGGLGQSGKGWRGGMGRGGHLTGHRWHPKTDSDDGDENIIIFTMTQGTPESNKEGGAGWWGLSGSARVQGQDVRRQKGEKK